MEVLNSIWVWVFGSGGTLLGLITMIAYWKQNKRTKEAEAKQKEMESEKAVVDVEKAKVDARKQEIDRLLVQIDHQQKTIDDILKLNSNLSSRLSKLNADIDKHIDRRRELCDKLSESEQETNRINRLLNDSKDEIIRLTEEKDRLDAIKCLRMDCKDPRGPKPPRKKAKEGTPPAENDNEK